MYLYQFKNKVSGRVYYGITDNVSRRNASHRYCVKKGIKTPFYDAVLTYNWENFDFSIVAEGDAETICSMEVGFIASDDTCYNLHPGGYVGFDVTTKPKDEVLKWRAKLSKARKGKTPFKGNKHSNDTKELCGSYGKMRRDLYGRYSEEVLNYGFAESNRKFGISKTHYYRLRKAAAV